MFRILALLPLPMICLGQGSLNGERLPVDKLNNEISPNELKRNASFNLDEIKVRWKKTALENCTGVPCVIEPPQPPAPSFTCGTSTVLDIDGNIYNSILIGAQCWTKENLKVTKYNDGTSIPLDVSGTSTGMVIQTWSTRNEGAYTIYANEPSSGTNATTYGFLYNWYAVKGITMSGINTYKNLCPTGFHVPTDLEWTTLTTYLGGVSVAGGKMKDTGTTLWSSPNTNAVNTSGFTALPGGGRRDPGNFDVIGATAFFWSATESTPTKAWIHFLGSGSGIAQRGDFSLKPFGASVRCLRD